MTALLASRNVPKMGSNECLPNLKGIPAKAAQKGFLGGIVCSSAGFGFPGKTGTGLVCEGVALTDWDNTALGAADGDVVIKVETGVFLMISDTAGDAVTAAAQGRVAYMNDDNVVSLTDGGGTRSPAGLVIRVDSAGVWILLGYAFMSIGDKRAIDQIAQVFGTGLTDAATQTMLVSAGYKRALPVLSQNGALTISPTGAILGDIVTITRTSVSAFTYAIVNGGPGAGTLFTMVASKANFARVQFDGTNWALLECGMS